MVIEEDVGTDPIRVATPDAPGRIRRRLRRTLRQLRAQYRHWARPDVVSHHGVHLPITPAVSETMRQVLYDARYEEREHQVLMRLLTRTDRVLELGTGLGFVTVICARKCGSSRVTSIEANPRMLPTIAETFRRNGVTPELRHGAVSRDGSDLQFFINDDFWSSSTVDRGGERTTVPGLAFEELVAQYQPTVIVMDIEGGEVQLVGAKISDGVRAIVLELHAGVTGAGAARSVREWIASEGFTATQDWGDRSVVVYERG